MSHSRGLSIDEDQDDNNLAFSNQRPAEDGLLKLPMTNSTLGNNKFDNESGMIDAGGCDTSRNYLMATQHDNFGNITRVSDPADE